MNQYISTFKNWTNYKGRASRKEYWMFYLITIALTFLLAFILAVLGVFEIISLEETENFINLLIFISIVPSMTVAIRRVHDSNKSGWFVLVPFYNLYLMLIKGDTEPNRFGEVPQ